MNRKIKLFTLLLPLTLVACTGVSSSVSSNENSSNSSSISESTSSDNSSSESISSDDSSTDSSSVETMDTKEIINNLKGSPYQMEMYANENLGLNNISNVGINQDRFVNEVLYPVPSEGTVYIAEDYGISFDGINNSGNLSLLLSNIANVDGNKIIKFKKGTYSFSTKVDVVGIENLYLVGEEGTTFEYSGWGTYFEAKMSKNVHISNINFDMKYSPTIAGEVKEVDNSNNDYCLVTLDVPEEFDLTQTLYQDWNALEDFGSYMECDFDEATQKYVPATNKNLMYNSPTSGGNRGILDASYRGAGELDIKLNKKYQFVKAPEIGTMVSFAYTMYENHGFKFTDCEEVYIENVDVYVAGGMGIRMDRGQNFYFNRFNFMNKEGSSRIMTCTADIVHACAVAGELKITNSTLEGSHDDALNIKSFYGKVASVVPALKEIEIVQTQTEVTIPFEKGDKIDIYDPETMGYVDSYVIEELQKNGTGYIVTVDKRPDRGIVNYSVGNDTKSTKLTLNNCLIRNKRNRGILLQVRNSEISNCTFQNVVMGAIQVLSVADQFREAIVPQNIVLRDNKFLNNQGRDISIFAYGSKGESASLPGTINNVLVENNYFYNGSGEAVNALACGELKVVNNLFNYENQTTNKVVNLKTSSDVNVENNVLYVKTGLNMTFLTQNNVTGLNENNNVSKGDE